MPQLLTHFTGALLYIPCEDSPVSAGDFFIFGYICLYNRGMDDNKDKRCSGCGRVFPPDNNSCGEPKFICPDFDCHNKDDKCCKIIYTVIPSSLGDDSEDSEVAPANGRFYNRLVRYEATNSLYFYDSMGNVTRLDESTKARDVDTALSISSINPVENRVITYALTNFFTESEWAEMWA